MLAIDRQTLAYTLLSAGLMTLHSGPLLAQTAGEGLQEITVTARKVTENLQDANVSITAVSGDSLANDGIKDLLDLESQLPGVRFSESGLSSILIRGVGTVNNQPGVDSAVLYSQDGTYMSHLQALPPMMFDIERIEVVRGPQGTLYGRNSNGGSLNIITNRPVLNEMRASAAATFGNYDAIDTNVMLNVPLGEKVAVRAAVATDKSDPYFDDGSEGTDNWAARLRMLVAPSDNFDVLATLEYSKIDDTGVGISYCPPRSDKPACAGYPWRPYAGFGAPGTFGTPEGQRGENPNYLTRDNYSAYVELNYRTSWATLTSLTNYHKYDMSNRYVWDYATDYRPIHKDKFYTQEIRLASQSDAKFSWVTGLFYAREKLNTLEYFDYNQRPGVRLRIPNGTVESEAIFGDVTIPVTSALSVVAGARYTYERKDTPGLSTAYDSTGTIPTTVATGDTPLTEKRPTWKGGITYKWAPDSMLYATVSNGFKSGGVNQVPAGIGLVEVYGPEKILAYQLGSKNRFLENRLQVNGEAFYYEYDNYQAITTARDPRGFFPGSFFTTINVQNAIFYGAEFESSARVFTGGQLDLALTLLHAEFELGSNRPGNAPKYTIGAAYQHIFNLANGGELRAKIDSQYVPGNYTSNNNFAASYQEAYTRTGANVSYLFPGRAWKIGAFVLNLEDKAVIRQGQLPTSRPGDNAFLMPPRQYGVSFEYNFGGSR
ncbi:MAG TPA: TonB-dependent receptor [Steroidobacteraceae bacterium]|jgi:iron complex outermembrane receptor protein|nr:TonB-dependent receptor [Steroidobacteraceae bacterium]